MKKRVLSLFMALMLCLTLLPTAALADELGSADGTSAVETAGADAEAEAKAKAGAEAVAAVQAMIGELPSLGELKGMDSDTLNEAYMAVQSAYDAYEALSEEQQAQVTGADRFEELFGWFNSQVAPLEDVYYYCDIVDVATGKMVQGSWSRTATASLTDGAGDTELTSNAVYVIAPNEQVTIRGSLTVPENSNDIYLFLCQNATLTIEGSLILNSNALTIFGSTTSLDAADSGKMIIENSGDGAAIQADGSNRNVTIRGGKLEIHSNTSKQITDAHASVLPSAWGNTGSGEYKVMKATLDGQQLEAADWDGKTQLTGGTLLIEWCGHPEDAIKYAAESDGSHHHQYCTLCGFEWPAASCTFDGKGGYDQGNDSGHYAKCVCGNVSSTQVGHTIQAVPKDGTYHVSKCTICGYEKAGREQHTYPDGIKCDKCGFIPVANAAYEDYASVKDAMDALVKDHVENQYVVTLCASSKIIDEAIVFDYPGKTITLDMAGCTLTSQNAVPLTVKSGTLRITGNANITQTGTSEDTYKPAIEVTGGHRLFGIVDGALLYAHEMAALGQGLTPHMSARLLRIGG